ncbi:Thiol-specific monooxygenase [Paramyrothecium foliicola]|nr:Thiol-specific monooxygenase [Paramyrothecium foliicola]
MAKSVCIVGAGPSGLVAAKTLLHNAPKGEFNVTVYDAQPAIGGLWPLSQADDHRQVHPLMLANQSKHTVQFSDLAWEDGAPQLPPAWMIGRYLQRYHDRYLAGNPSFDLQLGSKVVKAQKNNGSSQGWAVSAESDKGLVEKNFDYLLIASGFFGKPIIPVPLTGPQSIPVIHSSQYRDLKSLLPKDRRGGGKILIVGGQMSGVEIAGTIASHLSAATHAPDKSEIPDVESYTISHVIQRPIWVFPLHTTPEVSVQPSKMLFSTNKLQPGAAAAPFLPLDFSSYNLNNRPTPLSNSQGHITEDAARTFHGIYERALGTNQSEFSPLLSPNDEDRSQQSYLAVSDWYGEFVRSGLITLSKGKVESLQGDTAILAVTGEKVENIAAVVIATGFDPSPCLSFLPSDVLEKMHHSPQHVDQPLALKFHGTHHPDVLGLGFVGFYRSPYWGVMQMQARFLARLWAGSNTGSPLEQALQEKLNADDSIQRVLKLRDDPRISQFPMGDYLWLMQEFTQALSLKALPLPDRDVPRLPHNDLPLDMLTPARFPDPADSEETLHEAQLLLEDMQKVTIDGLTAPRFVPRAVFRSLLGTWKLERDLDSKLPTHPSGHFSGTAQFLLRNKTSEGLQCVSGGSNPSEPDTTGQEYLYIEEGEFKTQQGFGFRASRRYVWRYDDTREVLSVWFVKPEDQKRADYLFHEIEFEQPAGGREKGWPAKAGHLCIDDYYDVKYNFAFRAVNLREWSIEYTVKGPKKDYTIRGTYRRCLINSLGFLPPTSLGSTVASGNYPNGVMMAAEGKLEAYRARFTEIQSIHSLQVDLIEELLNDLDDTRATLSQTILDLENEKDGRRNLQKELRAFKEWKEEQEKRPFAVVLVDADADGYVFQDKYLVKGEAGGQEAADAFYLGLRRYLREINGLSENVVILVKAFANVGGLGASLVRDGRLQDVSQLQAFFRGFTSRKAFFELTDVGAGKERADNKIRVNSFYPEKPHPPHCLPIMKLAVFSAKSYDKKFLSAARDERENSNVDITYHDISLNEDTVALTRGAEAVCVFVNDSLPAPVIEQLAENKVRAILLRCAGFNNVDLQAAEKHGIVVANVPSYSPEAVAEFAVALIQTLNRRTHRAYNRVREANFLLEGLLGRTLNGKTVGFIGTGKIGLAAARIMRGFGCRLLAYDPYPAKAFEEYGQYRDLDSLLPECDIISLHCPLMDGTRHIINDDTIGKMKKGVMLVNTSRGGLVDTTAVIRGLKSKHLGSVALDVYEGEGDLFYNDHSGDVVQDDELMRLMSFPNVLVTGHQAFFTEEALHEIADCTLRNLDEFVAGECSNSLTKNIKGRQDTLPVRNV